MIGAAFFSAVAISLLIWILWRTLGPEGSLKRGQELKKRIVGSPSKENLNVSPSFEKTYRLSDAKIFEKFLSRYESSKEVANLLKRSRLKISVSVFLMSCLILGFLSFMGLRFYMRPFWASLFATVITLLPFLYLRLRNKRYLQKFAEYLPEALSMISGAIKSGLSLEVAIESAAKNTPYPVSVEFQAVVSEMRLGQPLQDAFQDLHQRIKSTETKIFVTGVAVQQELGGNLSEILDNLQKTIRERFAIQREIKVLSAQGVLTMWFLVLMPYVILGILYIGNAPMVKEFFFDSPMGRPAIFMILGLQVLAFLWMRWLVQLKD